MRFYRLRQVIIIERSQQRHDPLYPFFGSGEAKCCL